MNAEITLDVRPVRHVYFIAEDDLARFVEVASYCCTQWGGINNLIIPVHAVKETDDMTIQVHGWHLSMVARRHPDIFIDALSLPEDNAAHTALKIYLATERFSQPLMQWDVFLTTDYALHPLDIASSQQDASKPLLTVPGIFSGPDAASSPLEDAITAAAFGRIWPGQKKAYVEAYMLQVWDVLSPENMLRQQLLMHPQASVINLTLKELSNMGTEDAFPAPYFAIVVAQNVRDLCAFWNLRASSFGHNWLADRRVLLVSKGQLLHEQRTYLNALVRLLRERCVHPGIEINVDAFFYHSHDEEVSQFLHSRPEFQHQTAPLHFTQHFPPTSEETEGVQAGDEPLLGDAAPRAILFAEDKAVDGSVYHEYGGRRPTFSLSFTGDSSSLLTPKAGPRTLVPRVARIGLQSDFWNRFPAHPAVAHLIVPGSSFDVFLNTVQLHYQQALPRQGLERIFVALPHTWDMYRAYVHTKSYTVSPSDKMAYAEGLLGLVGGVQSDKVSVFRSRIAYEMLDMLTDKATNKLAREILQRIGSHENLEEEMLQQVIAASDVLPPYRRVPRYFSDIYSQVRNKLAPGELGKKDCLQALAQLVEAGVIQRGMYIKCPHCGTKIWYGIHILDERMRCSGCLELFPLPLTENPNDEGDRPFQYALNTLANQAMDQDILPVIITLLTVKTHHQAMYHIVPGMNFQEEGSVNRAGDFDFVYIYKHEVYGGECKAGRKLTEKDIRTARIAQKLGFRAFFFSTIRTFDEDGRELVQQYQQELAAQQDTEHPFAVFTLDEPILFGNQPLPPHIPQ